MARAGERSRDRYLTPLEIRAVWKAAEALGYPSGTLVQLLLLTGQRRDEVAGMRWDEIDGNEKLWTLGHGRTKAGRAQLVPLSDLAFDLINSCPRIGDFVLTTRGDRPVSGFAKWKKQLDDEVFRILDEDTKETKTRADGARLNTLPPWRLHDLRRTVGTHMEEIGIPPHIVGSVLNHSPRGFKGVTSVYTRGELIFDRRKALTAWSRYLSLLLDQATRLELGRLLKPETEVDAMRVSAFRAALQADRATWGTQARFPVWMTPRVVMTKTPFAEALDELHFAATEQYARSRVRAASGTPFNRSAALRDIETAVRAANVGWQRRGNQLPAAKLAKITRKLCGDIRRLQRAYQGAISRPFLLEQIVPSGGTSVAEFENEAKQVADILKRHEQQLRSGSKDRCQGLHTRIKERLPDF